VILTFVVPVILFAFLFKKKKLLRKHWYTLFSVGFVFTLLLSFVSVWSAWNPYALSGYLHEGNNLGVSGLSYPLQMNVYLAPLTDQGKLIVGNVSFDVLIANAKLLETNGTLSYDLITALLGRSGPVSYQLESPFFSNAIGFFGFLLFLFTLFDMVGFALGLILCYIVSRMLASRLQATSRNEPVTSASDNRT
jgi:hypothetical protein